MQIKPAGEESTVKQQSEMADSKTDENLGRN